MRVVLDAALPRSIVSTVSYRGDLQMHSTWSDGAESISSMAEAALALGWTRIGITDHSYGLPIAHGMSMAEAKAQHLEIDRVNEQSCRARAGLQRRRGQHPRRRIARSRAGGTRALRIRDCVAALAAAAGRRSDGAHGCGRSPPGVAILGHPQGRMYNARPGVSADWDRVFKEAAARSVAIEIDGNWHRQDIDYELAARALDAGCLFALDSDAHSIPELPFTDYAIAHARLARVPADRVVNCWDAGEFEAWLAETAGHNVEGSYKA